MELTGKLRTLLIATAIIWVSVAVVMLIDGGAIVQGAALILALISTITIWSMWGLDAYGINIDGSTPHEKPKRDTADDPRLSLLLSMLTPDERDALQTRLMADLNTDGESVSLADLLADQESAGRAS